MEKFKKIILILFFISLTLSCKDDGGTSVITLQEGVVPNLEKDASAEAFLDFLKIGNGENVGISFNVDIAQGNPKLSNILGVYRSVDGPVYRAELFNNISLPGTFSLTVTEILTAFPELSTTDDINLGDVLSITTSFVLGDDTVLNLINEDGTDNFSSNIKNSGIVNAVINYAVSCPSDIGGTYLVSSTGTGCCGVAPIENYEYTVTVTDNGGGVYSLSDFSGGAYDGLFCGAFSICGDASGGEITDVCGNLSGKNADCCGDEISFSGTDNGDGTWSVEISSGFIDITSTWVKQ